MHFNVYNKIEGKNACIQFSRQALNEHAASHFERSRELRLFALTN